MGSVVATSDKLMSVWPIFAVMVVFGAGRAFWMPASQAMTPNLVPPEAFPSAVALNSMLFEAGVIAGPALGGVLYLIGPSVVYCTMAVMLLVAVTLIFGHVSLSGARTLRPEALTVAGRLSRLLLDTT